MEILDKLDINNHTPNFSKFIKILCFENYKEQLYFSKQPPRTEDICAMVKEQLTKKAKVQKQLKVSVQEESAADDY